MINRRRTFRIKTKDIPALKQKLLALQKHRCALCELNLKNAPPKDICLDHCHGTGHIRAVLCRNCNAMEGKIFNCARRAKRERTPQEWMDTLIRYWATHRTTPTPWLHPNHRTEEEKRLRRNKRATKRRRAKKAARG